jgi:hypothetical protein
MNRKIGRLTVGLTAATLALGLGACGKSDRDGDREREPGSRAQERQRTTTEITMATLAGDWGFDPEEMRASFRDQMEQDLAAIEDPAQREQMRAQMQMFEQMMMGPLIEAISGTVVSLNADGTMTATLVDAEGNPETATGVWTLDGRDVTLTAGADEGPKEDLKGRVIDIDTMEMTLEDIGESGVMARLRRKS